MAVRRPIDDAALELFRQETAGTTPLNAETRIEPIMRLPPPIPVQSLLDAHAALVECFDGPISVDHAMDAGEELVYLRAGMSRTVLRKLRRGHWVTQDKLDLHGFNREQARLALSEFLSRSRKRGLRCVRVIHGKGFGSPGKEPVIKSKIKTWLAVRDEVLAFCQAPGHLGGGGALLVLLKG